MSEKITAIESRNPFDPDVSFGIREKEVGIAQFFFSGLPFIRLEGDVFPSFLRERAIILSRRPVLKEGIVSLNLAGVPPLFTERRVLLSILQHKYQRILSEAEIVYYESLEQEEFFNQVKLQTVLGTFPSVEIVDDANQYVGLELFSRLFRTNFSEIYQVSLRYGGGYRALISSLMTMAMKVGRLDTEDDFVKGRYRKTLLSFRGHLGKFRICLFNYFLSEKKYADFLTFLYGCSTSSL